jgi:hypothetical protein
VLAASSPAAAGLAAAGDEAANRCRQFWMRTNQRDADTSVALLGQVG